jgi:hypothetical protein
MGLGVEELEAGLLILISLLKVLRDFLADIFVTHTWCEHAGQPVQKHRWVFWRSHFYD